ncbi:hypothetical protein TCAL_12244 [Tigriopus californicus]|uniref:Uncharacterized protein n=1 Tax=Tigriopus californicus TaxID=6832 RepID=A0A553N6P2_TIGCA|nr:hypothetical protein TCAL_12244 [Tigriopus californicus]|eukprot:TCALIF_12244-PA protein Name:"Similar to ppk28 Pickpocket protein 28 (Drosophila melanogaster)" AED:0.25 eAED:0.25 QI:0/-1/0/1/-1/1/1/0/836
MSIQARQDDQTQKQDGRISKLERQMAEALKDSPKIQSNNCPPSETSLTTDGPKEKEIHLRSFVKEFFAQTTMHGTKYIAEEVNILDRLIWTVVVIAALSYSCYVVNESITEFQTNPTITSYESADIREVFFPAITVDGGSIWNHWGLTRALLDPLSDDGFATLNRRLGPLKIRLYQTIYPLILTHVESVLGRNITVQEIRDLHNDKDFPDGISALTTIFSNSEFQAFFQQPMFVNFGARYLENDLLTYLAAMRMDFPNETTDLLYNEFQDYVAEAIITLGKWHQHIWDERNSVLENVFNSLTDQFRPKQKSLDACTNGTDICLDALNYVGARLIALAIFRSDLVTFTEFGHFLERYFEAVHKMPLLWGQLKSLTESYLIFGEQSRGKRYSPPQGDIAPDLEPFPTSLEEQIVSDILTEGASRFFKTMELNMSLYEISQVLDLPYHAGEAQLYQAKEIYKRMKCYNFDYLGNFNTSKCGQDEHPKIAGCCRIWEAISTQHEGVLKMMRFNQQAPHWNSEDNAMFEEAQQGYFGDFEDIKKPYGVSNPRIFGCQWLGFPTEDHIASCNLFHRLFTNAGMGYTFNSADYEDLFLDTSYLNTFKTVMNAKIRSHGKPVILVDGPGPQNTLKIHVELSRQFDNFIKFGNPQYSWSGGIPRSSFRSLDKSFKIGIHHPGSLADLRNDYIKVKPGFEYQVLITPQVHTAEESLRSMPLEKRKCQFQDESSGSVLFKSYSQTNCQLECRLKLAVEQCGCLPWNYPHMVLDGQLTKLCDYRGNFCVEQILQQPTTLQDCRCYPLCETITYPYSMNMKVMERPCSSGEKISPLSCTFIYTKNVFPN